MTESGLTTDPDSLARYRDYLASLARALLGQGQGPAVDPSAVAQNALLAARAAREQFRGRTEQELAEWLRSILDTALANALRASGRQDASSPPGPGDLSEVLSARAGPVPADPGLPPEELAEHNGKLLRLAAALGRLPDDQRAVLEMRHLHGLTVSEICERTGHTKASVAGQLLLGTRGLRELLGKPGGAAPGEIPWRAT
jgi:RNA polymerase sigma-70 factor (ECF subfamily)